MDLLLKSLHSCPLSIALVSEHWNNQLCLYDESGFQLR
jgi:hypothetical protein